MLNIIWDGGVVSVAYCKVVYKRLGFVGRYVSLVKEFLICIDIKNNEEKLLQVLVQFQTSPACVWLDSRPKV